MKVTYQKYTSAAFAQITGDNFQMSVMLREGMTAGASLRSYAEDCREKAEALLKRAERAEAASYLI